MRRRRRSHRSYMHKWTQQNSFVAYKTRKPNTFFHQSDEIEEDEAPSHTFASMNLAHTERIIAYTTHTYIVFIYVCECSCLMCETYYIYSLYYTLCVTCGWSSPTFNVSYTKMFCLTLCFLLSRSLRVMCCIYICCI